MLEHQPTQATFYTVNGHTIYGVPPQPCSQHSFDDCPACGADR